MPTLGAPLDFAKLEGRNLRAHQLGAAPSSPVTGQLYYNTADNTLYWYDGTVWVSTRGSGAPPDATTSTKGMVQLAGDLTGTATSPQIAAGVITDAEVAAANKDGVVATPSMRTLGMGAQQAMPGNTRLNAIAAALGDVQINGFHLLQVADPVNSGDGANKQYVDNVATGLDAKLSVRVATTANLVGFAPSSTGGVTVLDGVTLVQWDRVLVKDQTTPKDNGIYVVNQVGTGTNGVWVRAGDFDNWTEMPGSYVFVEQGTVNADTGWVCTVDSGGTLNTTAITWTQFSGAGQIIAGAGLTKTGNQIDIYAAGQSGIVVNADNIQVAADVARYYSNGGTHGAGTTINITPGVHGLKGNQGILVQVHDVATGLEELPDVAITALGSVTITYAVAFVANSKNVTLIGTGV